NRPSTNGPAGSMCRQVNDRSFSKWASNSAMGQPFLPAQRFYYGSRIAVVSTAIITAALVIRHAGFAILDVPPGRPLRWAHDPPYASSLSDLCIRRPTHG